MDLARSWKVAIKDFKVFRTKTSVIYTLILLPLILSIGLPLVLIVTKRIHGANIIPLINSFSFIFIIIAGYAPVSISSYSIVGEKIEKTLEPLLATPITDGELLLGKSLAAFIPSIIVTYMGAVIFMILIDIISYAQLGYYYYPNYTIAVFLILVVPLACLLSVQTNIIVSRAVNDIRSSLQIGSLPLVPYLIIYVLSEIRFITLDAYTLLIISAILFIMNIFAFSVSRSTFRREEILNRLS